MRQRLNYTTRKLYIAAISVLPLLSTGVAADVIGTGSLFPNAATLQANPNVTGNLFIGFSATGSVEVNAENNTNGFTALSTTGDTSVGLGGNSSLRIEGNGASGSAQANITNRLFIAEGTIDILNGATALANDIQIGFANEDTKVSHATIDGTGSSLVVRGQSFGTSFGADELLNTANRSLTISNGGSVTVSGDTFGSRIDGAGGNITVNGNGSNLTFELEYFGGATVSGGGRIMQVETPGLFDGFANPNDFDSLKVGTFDEDQVFSVSGAGSEASVTRNAQIGGKMRTADVIFPPGGGFEFVDRPTFGTLLVDDGASFTADLDIRVGANESEGSGTLTVSNGGTVTANNVIVRGNGLLNGAGGTIDANVIVSGGGVLAPGSSPGDMAILGDLDLTGGGVLELEIGDIGIGNFDRLFVGGALALDNTTTILLSFIDGVAENPDALLNFDLSSFFFDIDPLNFDPNDPTAGAQAFDVALFDGVNFLAQGSNFTGGVEVDNQGNLRVINLATTASVPEPGTLALFGFGLAGLGYMRRRKKIA